MDEPSFSSWLGEEGAEGAEGAVLSLDAPRSVSALFVTGMGLTASGAAAAAAAAFSVSSPIFSVMALADTAVTGIAAISAT